MCTKQASLQLSLCLDKRSMLVSFVPVTQLSEPSA